MDIVFQTQQVADGIVFGNQVPGASGPMPDTADPTFDGVLTYSATANSISISWSGTTSADNVAVARREYRIGGTGAYTAATPEEETSKAHLFAGLGESTPYQIDVRCVDTSGNASDPLTIAVTTDAPAGGDGTNNYIRRKLAARTGEPHLNLATVHWSLYQQLLPSVFGMPAAQGVHAMTAGSAELQIAVPAAVVPAGWYMFAMSDPDGTTTVLSRILVGP